MKYLLKIHLGNILFMADEIDEDAGWPSEEINVAVTSQVEQILGEATWDPKMVP